jgi:hypothetical protein
LPVVLIVTELSADLCSHKSDHRVCYYLVSVKVPGAELQKKSCRLRIDPPWEDWNIFLATAKL